MSALATEILPPRAAIDGAVRLPVTLVAPSRTNPRKHFDPKTLAELAESVKKHGVLQPILARAIDGAKAGQPLYEIVAGERRWRACAIAKVEFIPAIVRTMSDFEVLELQVIENLQRDDLHPLEEAEGYQALMRAPDGAEGFATAEELAARIGKSRAYVYGRLKLCALIEPAKKAFLDGKINASTALLIARMPATIQADATKKIIQGWGGEPASFRQARDLLEREFMLKLGSAIFKITDETLVPAAGSCKACGKRSGANPDLFDDIKSGDVCTDPPCFAKKKEAHQLRLVETAKAEGREVITGAAAKKAMPHEYSSQMTGFMKLDEPDYRINGMKPLAKLLGKEAPPTVLLEHPRTKELIEVVRTDEAMKVLKDKGLITQAKRPTTNEADRRREAKAKAEAAWRMAVAERAVAAAVDKKFDGVTKLRDWLLVEVAIVLWHRLEHENEKRAEKLLGWEHINTGYGFAGPGAKKLEARIRKLTSAQLDQLFVAMAVAGQTHVNAYGVGGTPELLLRVAKGLRIDADKVKSELAAAAKAKTKPKPVAKKAAPVKEATKKAAAKTPAPQKVTVKYRDAATGSTWSGRGLQPAWMKAALKKGKKLGDFLVAAATPAPAKKATDAAPIAVKNGSTISAEAAWPFPTGSKP